MGTVAGLALVHVASESEAHARFAGRTLVERSVALAAAAGLRPILVGPAPDVRAGTPPGPAFDGCRETRSPGDPLPVVEPPGLPVVAWRCDAVFVAGVLRHLLAPGASREAVLRDDAGRVAIVRCDLERLGGRLPAGPDELATRIGATATDALRPRVLASGLDAPGGRWPRAVEAELVANLENPRDGLFDRLLNRRISRRLTPLLLDLPVTPNQVTLLSLLVGVLAAAAFAGPGWGWPVAGALLLQATAVLDCVDGEIARAKVLESERGEFLDVTSDTLVQVLAFLGIAIHEGPALGARRAWILGALFATGGLSSFAVVTRAERTEATWRSVDSTSARLLAAMLATLTTRDLSVLLLAAALLGWLGPLLFGAAAGAHAFWAIALLLHARATRAAESRSARVARETQSRSVTR